MAGLMDMFGGGDGSLYGDLLTPQQQQALAMRGLQGFLAGMQKSGALDYTAPFISGKVPAGFAAGLAGGIAGMGEAEDKAGLNALQATMLAQQAAALKSKNDFLQKIMLGLPGLSEVLGSAGSPQTFNNPVAAGAGSTATGAASDDPLALIRTHESAGNYNIGYGGADLSNAPRNEYGFPIWEGKDGSHAAGAYQFQPATWAQYAKPLGIKDFSPASQDAVARAAYLDQGFKPWAPYNSSLAAAISRGAGQGAPGVGAVGGGPVQLASANLGGDTADAPDGLLPAGTYMPTPALGMRSGLLNPTSVGAGERGAAAYMTPPTTGLSVGGAFAQPAARPVPFGVPAFTPPPIRAAQAAIPAAPQPAAVTPTFGSLAPGGGLSPQAMRTILGLGIAGDLAGIPSLGNLLTGTPMYKGAVTSAEEAARDPFLRGRAEQGAALDIYKAGPIAQAQQAAQLEREATIARLNQQLDIGKAAPIAQAQQQAQQDREAFIANLNQQLDIAKAGPAATAKQFAESLDKRRGEALAARSTLEFSNDARKLIDAGIISGFGANTVLNARKALDWFGGDQTKVVNTEAFLASRAREVARVLSSGAFGAGTGISDEDRRWAQRIASGDITLNGESMRRIIDMSDKAANYTIDTFNKDATKFAPSSSYLQVDKPTPGVPSLGVGQSWTAPNGAVVKRVN